MENDPFKNFSLMRDCAAPAMVSFDLTSNCNLKCVHCFNDSGTDAPNTDLPPAKKLDIAREIAALHPLNVCLCGGETLCCPNLFEIIDILAPHVGKLSMVSNGYLMTENMAKRLVDSGLKLIQISIDGAYAWQHDSFRGVPGSFEHATAALDNLRKAKTQRVDVSLVPNKMNFDTMDAYFKMCSEKGVNEIRMMPFLPSGRGRSVGRNLMLSEGEYFRFMRDIERLREEYRGYPDVQWGDPLDHMRRMPENAKNGLHTYVMEIKTDGNLVLSTYLPVVVGNVAKHTLREYWDGGMHHMWGMEKYTQYTDKIRNIYDLDDFEPKPYSGELIVSDILEGE